MKVKDYGEDVITVISLNLQKDGGPDTQGVDFPRRWYDVHTKILKPRRATELGSTRSSHSTTRPRRTTSYANSAESGSPETVRPQPGSYVCPLDCQWHWPSSSAPSPPARTNPWQPQPPH
ncbi:hypothetical protein [Streptomyces bottropensis]|uniref:hypothetical protein n=1 Tax=Streptomyces bottropensis TaxID=42235 RepID=UPI00369EE8D6